MRLLPQNRELGDGHTLLSQLDSNSSVDMIRPLLYHYCETDIHINIGG
jgi:hypothetical protein